MKWITKDHKSITKDYENIFYSMKDQCKKKFPHCISGYTFQFPNIGGESPAFMT